MDFQLTINRNGICARHEKEFFGLVVTWSWIFPDEFGEFPALISAWYFPNQDVRLTNDNKPVITLNQENNVLISLLDSGLGYPRHWLRALIPVVQYSSFMASFS